MLTTFMRKQVLLLLALPTLFVSPVARAEALPPASQWLPPNPAVVVEVTQPAALLEPLLRSELAKAVNAGLAQQKPNLKLQQLQGIVAYLELQLGTDWRTGLRRLLNRGLILAVQPDGATVLSVDAQDEKLLQQLQELFRTFAAAEAAKQEQPQRVASRSYRGVTAWTFGPNEAHALLGQRLLLANPPELLNQVLDRRAEATDQTLAASSFYQAARQALGKETAATIFLNLQVLRQHPKLKRALEADGNPLATLLLTDTKEALRQAHWLAVGVSVKDDKLLLKLVTDGQSPASAKTLEFASPHGSEEGILPNLRLPGGIASLSLYRDLRAFYAAKDDLFPERTSGLIFFENMMGIFFSGIELTDGVLGETKPDIRVVVAAQQYDPAVGTPGVQVPAFAAVLRLRHPQAFGETVEEAWQKALGLVNFTRGQKALPGLIINHDSHADVKYTLSYFRPPGDKDKTAIADRYNYRPTLARPGDYLILSSTDGLAKDLIDALKRETAQGAKPSPAAHSLMEIDGTALHAILQVNREHLIRKNMLEKGNSRDQAEGEIGTFLTLLSSLNRATLTLNREHGRPQATLELQLQVPKTPAPPEAGKSAIRNSNSETNLKEQSIKPSA